MWGQTDERPASCTRTGGTWIHGKRIHLSVDRQASSGAYVVCGFSYSTATWTIGVVRQHRAHELQGRAGIGDVVGDEHPLATEVGQVRLPGR